MGIYGFCAGILCIISFALVVFGFGDGNLGIDCNSSTNFDCETVYRGRTTTFTVLTCFILILAWEMSNMRQSLSHMLPAPTSPGAWQRKAFRNPFLFWSIVGGFFSVFPAIYIPSINTQLFKHGPIGREWGIVFVETVMFFSVVKAWKFAKGAYRVRSSEMVNKILRRGKKTPVKDECCARCAKRAEKRKCPTGRTCAV